MSGHKTVSKEEALMIYVICCIFSVLVFIIFRVSYINTGEGFLVYQLSKVVLIINILNFKLFRKIKKGLYTVGDPERIVCRSYLAPVLLLFPYTTLTLMIGLIISYIIIVGIKYPLNLGF